MQIERSRLPSGKDFRMRPDLPECREHYDEIEREVDRHDDNGGTDDLAEAAQKHRSEHEQQPECHEHRVVKRFRYKRILDEMRGGVCRRQGNRDDEAGGSESKQNQDDRFTLPAREERFEHHDAALAVRARLGNAVIHRQCAD